MISCIRIERLARPKALLVVCIATLLSCMGVTTAAYAATHYLLGYSSVDCGEISGRDNTVYNATMAHAHTVWDRGCVAIAQDGPFTSADVLWADETNSAVSWDGEYRHHAISTDEIISIGTTWIRTVSSTSELVAAHEFGHALGLAHSYSGQLMAASGFATNTPVSQENLRLQLSLV
ncbi:matrixin family metalloprotease [Planotetraspora sp. GP83]|uniref:matrixin family metalloprotease n=1 Tax=Planotetraspora sp. GP83 TaxID=3156264 RepID=UPI003519AB4F